MASQSWPFSIGVDSVGRLVSFLTSGVVDIGTSAATAASGNLTGLAVAMQTEGVVSLAMVRLGFCAALHALDWKTTNNWPVSHSARHQRHARERHKIRIASRENVDNQTPRNTNFTH